MRKIDEKRKLLLNSMNLFYDTLYEGVISLQLQNTNATQGKVLVEFEGEIVLTVNINTGTQTNIDLTGYVGLKKIYLKSFNSTIFNAVRANDVYFQNFPNATSIGITYHSYGGNPINLTNNRVLKTINFSNGNYDEVNFHPELTNLENLYLSGSPESFPTLNWSNQDFRIIEFNRSSIRDSELVFSEHPNLQRINFYLMPLINGQRFQDYVDLDFSGNPNINYVRLSRMNMTQQVVNEMVISLDNSGATNGRLEYQDFSSPPADGLGFTAENNLIAKGWNVIHR